MKGFKCAGTFLENQSNILLINISVCFSALQLFDFGNKLLNNLSIQLASIVIVYNPAQIKKILSDRKTNKKKNAAVNNYSP